MSHPVLPTIGSREDGYTRPRRLNTMTTIKIKVKHHDSRRSCLVEHGGAIEDLRVDFSEDAGICSEGGRDVLAAQEESNRSFEQSLKSGALH